MLCLPLIAACSPLATHEPRAARSSLGCIHAALAGSDFDGLSDAAAHCLATGLIARRCSATEALLASIGKELQDLVGPGDAEWRDLRADRAGVECAKQSANEAALAACCVSAV
jgi:hypothetical protein